jgi:osmotically-inducible protein OsmY
MADYNRNQRGTYRTSNQEWNENRGRTGRYDDDDRNYGWSENRGYNNSSNREMDDNASWQSRYERDDRGSNSGSQRYGNQYDSDSNSNYGDRYGYTNAGNQSYGSQSSYDMSRGNSYRDRNLYDRDYEGSGRSAYAGSGTRFGGANYGSYGDQNRGYYEGRHEARGGYYGGNYGNSPSYRNREDRTWWDRASDEVSSWFGDDEAERRRDRDRMQQSFRGKGPKNYSRSDDRIKDDINDRLSDDPFIDASEIEVTVSNGEVTLTGTVDHRSTKRRAEDLAEAVSGVRNVENRIRTGQTSDKNSEKQTETVGTTSSSGTQSTSGVAGSERTRNKSYVTG